MSKTSVKLLSSIMSFKIAVVGAGLVGQVQAIMLKKKGFSVTIYEKRKDPRIPENESGGRSFDLALSRRGMDALKSIGLDHMIANESKSVKVYSRLIHNINNSTSVWKYSEYEGDFLLSIQRQELNKFLLNEAEENDIPIHFEHDLVRCDTETGKLHFNVGESKRSAIEKFDFIFGCDGAYSSVRTNGILKNKEALAGFSQHYVRHGYREIHVPPSTETGGFVFSKNHLHLWPRNDFMLMGLPNPDKSITLTLFMPIKTFSELKNNHELTQFFLKHFPDAFYIIGEENLAREYFDKKTGHMVSVKLSTHHCGKALLLGDAAHAMVPFYGQGVNAGFEDCLIFNEILDKQMRLYSDDTSRAFTEAASKYSSNHVKDTHAIVELSLYNYEEMRKLMNSTLFWLSKDFNRQLHRLCRKKYTPLYSMVTFSRMPYSEVKAKHIQQCTFQNRSLILSIAYALLVLIVVLVFCCLNGIVPQELLPFLYMLLTLPILIFTTSYYQYEWKHTFDF